MSSLPFARSPLALLVASLFCAPVLAQANDAGGVAQATGQTAAKSQTVATKVHQPVTVTGRAETATVLEQDLEQKQPENLRDALQDISSLSVINMGHGQMGDIEIRGIGGSSGMMGAGANRVTMEVDGMEVSQSFNFGHDMRFGREYIDPADLKSIDVDKGPGAAGLAGAVRLRTKDPVDYLREGKDFGGNAHLGGRTDERSLNAGVTLAARLGEGSSAMLSYTRRSYHEVVNSGGEAGTGPARTLSNPLEATSNSLSAKWVYQPSRDHRLTLGYQHFDTRRDTTLLSDYGTRRTAATVTTTHGKTNRQDSQRDALMLRHDIHAATAWFDTASWQLSLQRTASEGSTWTDATSSRLRPRVTAPVRSQSTSANEFTSQNLALRADFDKTLGDAGLRHHLSYGIRLSRSETDMDTSRVAVSGNLRSERNLEYFPSSTQWQIRLNAADRISFGDGAWSVTPSVNVTHIRVNPTLEVLNTPQPGTGKYAKTAVGGGLRVDWRVLPAQVLSLAVNRSTRLPGYGETNAQDYGHWIGRPNPNLKPERADGIELSWASRTGTLHQKTTLFYNRYTNLIDVDCGPNFSADVCEVYNNPGKQTAYGLEWDGRYQLSDLLGGGLARGLTLGGGLSWVKGKAAGQPRARIDPPGGYLALGYDHPSAHWGMDARLRFAAAKKAKDLPRGISPLAGWGTLDLTFYFTPVKDMKVNVGIYNVFDKRYAKWSRVRGQSPADYIRYTEPGMNVGINLRYQF